MHTCTHISLCMPNIFEHALRVPCNSIASVIEFDNSECYVKFKPTNQGCSHSEFSESINMLVISTLTVIFENFGGLVKQKTF